MFSLAKVHVQKRQVVRVFLPVGRQEVRMTALIPGVIHHMGFLQLEDVLVDADLPVRKGETTDVLDLIALELDIFQQQCLEHEPNNKKRKDLADDVVGEMVLFSLLDDEGGEGDVLDQAFGVLDILGMEDALFEVQLLFFRTDPKIIGKQGMDLGKDGKVFGDQFDTEFFSLAETTKIVLLDVGPTGEFPKCHILVQQLPVFILDMVCEFQKNWVLNFHAGPVVFSFREENI